MTCKNTKTILFGTLIAAMILLFSGMSFVDAKEVNNTEADSDNFEPQLETYAKSEVHDNIYDDFESYPISSTPSNMTYEYLIGAEGDNVSPDIEIHGVSDELSYDGNNSYKIHLKHTRPSASEGVANRGNIVLDNLSTDLVDLSMDVYGDLLNAAGSESAAGSGIAVGILYHISTEMKLISISTHTQSDKEIRPSFMYNGTKISPNVEIYDFHDQETWATVSENIESLYNDNFLGNYEDVVSWSLLFGGKGWTSQVSHPVEWRGYFDNISILSPLDFCGELESFYNVINGTNSIDYIIGTTEPDLIFGNDGDDLIISRGNNNCIYAGNGNDKILTADTGTIVYGGVGDDFIMLKDTASGYGEDDDDTIYITTPDIGHMIDGGNGTDMCVTSSMVILNTTNCEIE